MGNATKSGTCRNTGHFFCGFLWYGFMYIVFAWVDVISQQTNINSTARPVQIHKVCPGVEYLTKLSATNITFMEMNRTDCRVSRADVTLHSGVLYGECEESTMYCYLHIEVPQGMFLRVQFQRLEYWCSSHQWKTLMFGLNSYALQCGRHSFEEKFVDTSTNHLFIYHLSHPLVQINIEIIKDHNLALDYISPHSGYVTLPQQSCQYGSVDYWGELKAPFTCVIMVSFQIMYGEAYKKSIPCTELIYRDSKKDKRNVVRVCSEHSEHYIPPRVFPTSHIEIHANTGQSKRCKKYYSKLKIIFSFLSETDQPQKLTSTLFNCSVNYYSNFQYHLDCNLKTECESGQDETEHCSFSSPGCQGLVASRNKCFQHLRLRLSSQSSQISRYECLKIDGHLASIKTKKELTDLLPLFKNYETFLVAIGLTSGWYGVPFMYRKFCKWSDNTLIYNMDKLFNIKRYVETRVYFGKISSMQISCTVELITYKYNDVLCERHPNSDSKVPVQKVKITDLHPALPFLEHNMQNLFVCPDGHLTHAFLSCDPGSHCGKIIYTQLCTLQIMGTKNDVSLLPEEGSEYTVDMFVCDDDITILPYTLVCDFRQDCPDNSDESFCEHPPCTEFLCSNSQCVLVSQRCNDHSDCLDDSDEMNCHAMHRTEARDADKNKQFLVNLDGTGYFTQSVMKKDESCPDTHYRCTADWSYCLPVYTRCNGFADCIYGEDEQDCETMICPGFYRCRGSRVCVHENHLCDGWGQCPHRDDEWLCGMVCPEGCHCQGDSFLCSQSFSANLFLQLRYVDATGSRMTMSNFSDNHYLIHLSLSRCSLVNISEVNLFNLQVISLTNNYLKTVNMNTFLKLSNLRVLLLANNPLTQLSTNRSHYVNYALSKIDISRTRIENLGIKLCTYLPRVKYLNVSFSAMKTIESTSLNYMPQVTQLDIRGNPIRDVPINLLSGLNNLKRIFSPDYRLCCESLLPKGSSKISCSAPQPVFSSCAKMIAVELFRLLYWLFSICSILGSSICLMTLIPLKRTFKGNFISFISNLQFGNVCTGIHISIVTAANESFSGKYVHFERSWTNNTTCKMAGFLFLMSSEVSVLIIWFITLDYVVILCFPLSRWRLSFRLTIVVCVITWCVCIFLSLIPFLPGLSHLVLYGQSGLCHFIFLDPYSSKKETTLFLVIVVFNSVLCSVIVFGQIIIYKRTSFYQILIHSSKGSDYCSSHLLPVAVTDVASWLPLGLTSAMVLSGVDAVNKLHVVIVLMLPLKSALNPLLYMYTVATQQQQQAQKDKLLQLLKLRLSLSRKT